MCSLTGKTWPLTTLHDGLFWEPFFFFEKSFRNFCLTVIFGGWMCFKVRAGWSGLNIYNRFSILNLLGSYFRPWYYLSSICKAIRFALTVLDKKCKVKKHVCTKTFLPQISFQEICCWEVLPSCDCFMNILTAAKLQNITSNWYHFMLLAIVIELVERLSQILLIIPFW